MGIIFINYRRDNTAGEARALFNSLVQQLGADRVFMDVDNIALGRDFREVLRQRLDDCDVMLTLIGRGWADARDASGQRRLEQTNDFVRLEIATALQRNVAVTPVLVQDARMPAADALPDDLKPLAFRNGFEISHQTWDSNVRELVARLGLAPAARSEVPRSRTPMLAGVAALAVAGAAGAWFVTRQPPAPPPAVAAAEKDVAGAPAPAVVEPAASAALPLVAAAPVPESKPTEPVPAPAPAPESPPAPAPVPTPKATPAPRPAEAPPTKAAVAAPVQEAPRPAPAPVTAAAPAPVITATPAPVPVTAAAPSLPVEALVDALVSQDAKARQEASEVLNRDHLRSREAVRAAVAYLPYERFHTLRTVAQRAQLLNFLLATEDAAWTPQLRAEGASALASVQAKIRANPGGFRAENVQRVDALAARLGG